MRRLTLGVLLALAACSSSTSAPRESIDLPPTSAPGGGYQSNLNYSRPADTPEGPKPGERPAPVVYDHIQIKDADGQKQTITIERPTFPPR